MISMILGIYGLTTATFKDGLPMIWCVDIFVRESLSLLSFLMFGAASITSVFFMYQE